MNRTYNQAAEVLRKTLLFFGFFLLSGHAAWAEEPMTFERLSLPGVIACRLDHSARCATAIVADGEITSTTPEEFVDFLKKNSAGRYRGTVVFLNSPGGKVVAAMRLGQVLRRIDAKVIVARVIPVPQGSHDLPLFISARCYSACVYALMGGRTRITPRQSLLGIHRMFNIVGGRDATGGDEAPRKVYDDGLLGRALADYAHMMGISPELVSRAENVPSETIHILSAAEIRRWRLGTAGRF